MPGGIIRSFSWMLVVLLPVLTAACNTMEGAGEDIAKGGEKLEESAERNKNY